jgi:hypothetical protein
MVFMEKIIHLPKLLKLIFYLGEGFMISPFFSPSNLSLSQNDSASGLWEKNPIIISKMQSFLWS